MESEQSSNGEDIDNEFQSKFQIDCEKGNSTKTSKNGKENVEGNPNNSPGSSTHNKNESEVSRPVLQSNTEKLPIESEIYQPRIIGPKFLNETELESKDNSFQKSRSTLSKTISETKDNSNQISSPDIPNEGLSDSEANLTKITHPVFHEEGSSDSDANKAPIPVLGVSEETGLESKLWSFQITSPNENASGSSIKSPLLFNFLTPSEGSSEISPLSSRIFTFHASRNDCLSLEGSESFFKFSEKSTRNRSKRDWKKAVRKQIYQLTSNYRQDIDDCQVVSPSKTKNTEVECKFSSFNISGSINLEETATKTKNNLSPRAIHKVPDTTDSESKEQLFGTHSLKVFDETNLENKFRSLQITNPVNPDEVYTENASSPWEPRPRTSGGHLLNPDFELKIDAFIESILGTASSRETQLFFNVQETKKSSNKQEKETRKEKRYHLPSKDSKNEENDYPVYPTKTAEIQSDKFSFLDPNWSLASFEADPRCAKFLKNRRVLVLDEDTIRDLAILSSDCPCWQSKFKRASSRSINTTELNKSHFEPSHRDNPVVSKNTSTSKIFPSVQTVLDFKSLQGKRDANNKDKSRAEEKFSQIDDSSVQYNQNSRNPRRNTGRNRIKYVSLNAGDGVHIRFPVPKYPLRKKRSGKETPGGKAQNMSETNITGKETPGGNAKKISETNVTGKETPGGKAQNMSETNITEKETPGGNAQNMSETNINRSRSSISKTDNKEMIRNLSPSDSRKSESEKNE